MFKKKLHLKKFFAILFAGLLLCFSNISYAQNGEFISQNIFELLNESDNGIKIHKAKETSKYGYRTHPIYKTKKFHNGIDLSAPKGTPIPVAAPGKVIRKHRSNSFGNVVYVQHIGGYVSIYAHLDNFGDVNQGDNLSAGTILGGMGTTGISSGVHLHYEVRKNGKSVNPVSLRPASASEEAGLTDVGQVEFALARYSLDFTATNQEYNEWLVEVEKTEGLWEDVPSLQEEEKAFELLFGVFDTGQMCSECIVVSFFYDNMGMLASKIYFLFTRMAILFIGILFAYELIKGLVFKFWGAAFDGGNVADYDFIWSNTVKILKIMLVVGILFIPPKWIFKYTINPILSSASWVSSMMLESVKEDGFEDKADYRTRKLLEYQEKGVYNSVMGQEKDKYNEHIFDDGIKYNIMYITSMFSDVSNYGMRLGYEIVGSGASLYLIQEGIILGVERAVPAVLNLFTYGAGGKVATLAKKYGKFLVKPINKIKRFFGSKSGKVVKAVGSTARKVGKWTYLKIIGLGLVILGLYFSFFVKVVLTMVDFAFQLCFAVITIPLFLIGFPFGKYKEHGVKAINLAFSATSYFIMMSVILVFIHIVFDQFMMTDYINIFNNNAVESLKSIFDSFGSGIDVNWMGVPKILIFLGQNIDVMIFFFVIILIATTLFENIPSYCKSYLIHYSPGEFYGRLYETGKGLVKKVKDTTAEGVPLLKEYVLKGKNKDGTASSNPSIGSGLGASDSEASLPPSSDTERASDDIDEPVAERTPDEPDDEDLGGPDEVILSADDPDEENDLDEEKEIVLNTLRQAEDEIEVFSNSATMLSAKQSFEQTAKSVPDDIVNEAKKEGDMVVDGQLEEEEAINNVVKKNSMVNLKEIINDEDFLNSLSEDERKILRIALEQEDAIEFLNIMKVDRSLDEFKDILRKALSSRLGDLTEEEISQSVEKISNGQKEDGAFSNEEKEAVSEAEKIVKDNISSKVNVFVAKKLLEDDGFKVDVQNSDTELSSVEPENVDSKKAEKIIAKIGQAENISYEKAKKLIEDYVDYKSSFNVGGQEEVSLKDVLLDYLDAGRKVLEAKLLDMQYFDDNSMEGFVRRKLKQLKRIEKDRYYLDPIDLKDQYGDVDSLKKDMVDLYKKLGYDALVYNIERQEKKRKRKLERDNFSDDEIDV